MVFDNRQAVATLRELRKRLRFLLHIKSAQMTRAAVLILRRLIRYLEKLYPLAHGVTTGAVLLSAVCGISACGGGGGGGGVAIPDLTIEQKIEAAEKKAIEKGCSVLDKNTNYSVLAGGTNNYGSNNVLKQGGQPGVIETIQGSITISCNGTNYNFSFANNTTQ